jgi:hypothetical protein
MTIKWKFIVILSILLVITSIIGNQMANDPHSFSAHPWMISIIYFPIVLYFAINNADKKFYNNQITIKEAFRYGTIISFYTTIIFSVFTILYSYLFFSIESKLGMNTLTFFLMTFIFTIFLGLLFTLIISSFISVRKKRI